jgi:hypothetical protein
LNQPVFTSITELSERTGVFIFSGIIRNYFLGYGEARDVDIVLTDEVDIAQIFKNYEIKKNSFGGFKISVDNTTIDIWYLKNTWAIQREPTLFELEDRIPYTAFFNFSAIVYSFNEKKFIYSKDFIRFLRDKRMDVVYVPNANYDLCIVNTIYYSEKYKLKISDKLKKMVKGLHKRSRKRYAAVQKKHFGEVLYSDREIDKMIKSLTLEKHH